MEFKIGDLVRRKEGAIPDNQLGAKGLSIDTPYEIIWIAPNKLCVLSDYLMLVNPEYLELVTK